MGDGRGALANFTEGLQSLSQERGRSRRVREGVQRPDESAYGAELIKSSEEFARSLLRSPLSWLRDCSRGNHEPKLPARPPRLFPTSIPRPRPISTLQIQLQIPILYPPHPAQYLPKHKGQHSRKQEAHQKDAHPHTGSAAHGRIYADGAYQPAGTHA